MSIQELITLFNQYPSITSVVAFVLGFTSDFAWSRWSYWCEQRDPFKASNWSLMIYLSGLMFTFMVLSYNVIVIMAYIVGSYLGTYIAVENEKIKDKKKND